MSSQARYVMAMVCAVLITACLTVPATQGQERSGIAAQGASLDLITSVPRTMTYQGILKDGDGNPIRNESKDIIFRIYDDATAGELEWDETIQITTDDGGYFTATLSNLEIPFDEDYWLELEVDSEILSPRQKLNMVAYAAVSDTADYARTAAGGGWVDDGAVVRLETSTDKVGIGTASPTNQVHIFGSDSAPLLNVEKVGPGRGVRVSTSSACALWVENSGNHGLRVTNANGDGIHVENAGGWAGYFNGTGYFSGDVGIGTTDPDEKLDLAGNLRFTEQNLTRKIYVEKSDDEDEPGRNLEIYAGEYSDAGFAETKDGGDLILHGGRGYGLAGGDVFIYGGSGLMANPIGDVIMAHDGVASGGNVGIGTETPSEKLEVSGTTQMTGFKMPTDASDGYVLTSDINGVGTWQAAAGGGIDGSGTANYVPKFTASTTLGNSMIYDNGSNVGIGTTIPGYKLDVEGTVGINIGSYFNDIPLTIHVPSNQAGLISRIAKGGNIINVVDNNGNVGIGTFSPQGALDVSSTTGALIVPRMTTAQRDALTAVNGMIIYNTLTNQFNFYENGAWVTK